MSALVNSEDSQPLVSFLARDIVSSDKFSFLLEGVGLDGSAGTATCMGVRRALRFTKFNETSRPLASTEATTLPTRKRSFRA